jgi:hypothetical protein
MQPQAAAQAPIQLPQQIPMANFAPPMQQGMAGMLPPSAISQGTPQQVTAAMTGGGEMTGSKPGMILRLLISTLQRENPGLSDEEAYQQAVAWAQKMGIGE